MQRLAGQPATTAYVCWGSLVHACHARWLVVQDELARGIWVLATGVVRCLLFYSGCFVFYSVLSTVLQQAVSL
jgi:hypothetical protein